VHSKRTSSSGNSERLWGACQGPAVKRLARTQSPERKAAEPELKRLPSSQTPIATGRRRSISARGPYSELLVRPASSICRCGTNPKPGAEDRRKHPKSIAPGCTGPSAGVIRVRMVVMTAAATRATARENIPPIVPYQNDFQDPVQK
jgi:hypothetical protein